VGLKEQVQADIKECMKSANKSKLNVLRMLLSELQYAQTAVDASVKLDDAQALKVAAAYQKRLQKSLADFPEGEKKEQILFEIGIVDHYLPKKASQDDVENAISRLLASTAERNFGALMKQVMVDLGDAADGKLVSKILKDKLAT
jgi:uncharacterized protein YqeY